MQRDSASAPTRAALVLLLVVAASAIVALSATGAGLIQPPASLDGWRASAVRAAGALAVAAGVAVLVRERLRLPPQTGHGPDPTAARLTAAAVIMGVIALTSLMMMPPSAEEIAATHPQSAPPDSLSEPDPRRDARGARRSRPPPSRLPIRGAGGSRSGVPAVPGDAPIFGAAGFEDEPGASLLRQVARVLLVLLLSAIAVISFFVLTRRRRPMVEEPPRLIEVAAAEAALEASLGDVAYDGPDPRLQITAAYHRLLVALADAGAPREAQEAPHEHLHRVLGPLGVRPEPMHRLTELYVLAQFSRHAVTERHRAAAAGALEESLRGLRAVQAEPAGAA